jgi:multiple sugar transport system permease protein
VTARSRRLGDVLAWLFLLALGALWAFPFLWMVSASLKRLDEIYAFPPTVLPEALRWGNYVEAWTALPFSTFFANSAIVTVSVTFGQLATCSLAGYAFARLRFPGRDTIFLCYLATMMVPFPVTMIPVFILMRQLHLVDTLPGLILPGLFSAWGTFLMRQFMLNIPRELEEAARIDGCSVAGIYARIIVPLSTPVFATLAIFTFLHHWNAFLWPLIMISSIGKKTLPLGLAMFRAQMSAIDIPWHLVMAAATFSIVPILLVFVLAQKYYVRGIALTGLKGAA